MSSKTTILNSNMFFDCPDGTTVEITAEACDTTETFYVQTSEGEYRSDLGCWITTINSNGNILASDYPDFDFDLIIKEAEAVIKAERDLTDTKHNTTNDQNIFIVFENNEYKVLALNHDFINSDTNSYQHRFDEELDSFCTKKEAIDFVKENFKRA